MDPERRTLLSVKLEDIAECETIFSTLMGEDVEARRKFIEENALDVKNLDNHLRFWPPRFVVSLYATDRTPMNQYASAFSVLPLGWFASSSRGMAHAIAFSRASIVQMTLLRSEEMPPSTWKRTAAGVGWK